MKVELQSLRGEWVLDMSRECAEQLQLQQGSTVTMQLHGTELVLSVHIRPSLDDLLIGVTPELIGGEVVW